MPGMFIASFNQKTVAFDARQPFYYRVNGSIYLPFSFGGGRASNLDVDDKTVASFVNEKQNVWRQLSFSTFKYDGLAKMSALFTVPFSRCLVEVGERKSLVGIKPFFFLELRSGYLNSPFFSTLSICSSVSFLWVECPEQWREQLWLCSLRIVFNIHLPIYFLERREKGVRCARMLSVAFFLILQTGVRYQGQISSIKFFRRQKKRAVSECFIVNAYLWPRAHLCDRKEFFTAKPYSVSWGESMPAVS